MSMLMKGMALRNPDDLPYPVYVEQKLDEIRCRVWLNPEHGVQFDSYAEKPLLNMESFKDQFYEFMCDTGVFELDMGILVNGNFGDSQRWTRSKGHPPEKVEKQTGKVMPALDPSMVEFYLFDMPMDLRTFKYRSMTRASAAMQLSQTGVRCRLPIGLPVNDTEQLLEFYEQQRADGIEGAMIKELDHKYRRGKAVGGWWKMKPSDTIDGKIVGFTEAVSQEGVPLGRVGSVDVVMEDDSTASPGGFSHALATDIFQNFDKYRDRWLEFDYMERDRQGGYRHPVYKRFREDKM